MIGLVNLSTEEASDLYGLVAQEVERYKKAICSSQCM